MIFVSQEKAVKDMAKNAAEYTGVRKWSRGAYVSPESRKNETDYHAFSNNLEDDIISTSSSIEVMLNDKSWNRRMAAMVDLERLVGYATKNILDKHLRKIYSPLLTTMTDSNQEISQKGFQLMRSLVKTVGDRIAPYLAASIPKMLLKMGSCKGIQKEGMGVFKDLMDTFGTMEIVTEVIKNGLQSKSYHVRGESINVIISGLISHGKINRLHIANDLAPYMADASAKVRQACFEAMALITNRLVDSELAQVVAMVGSVHKSSMLPSLDIDELNLMDAFHARLARNSVPTLDKEGLVKYSIPVLSPGMTHVGADVDWITAVSVSPPQTDSSSPPREQSNDNSFSGATDLSSSFRPYRSAGKRPWELEERNEASTNTIPPAPPHLNLNQTPPVTSSYSYHPNPLTSNTNPRRLPGNSYVDLHFSKLSRKPPQPSFSQRNSLGSLNPPRLGSKERKVSSEHNSIPEEAALEEGHHRHYSDMQSSSVSTGGSTSGYSGSGGSMPMTWPKTIAGLRSGSPGMMNNTVPPLNFKGSTQINADAVGAAGIQNTVKTSFSRPLSKPRVRNPLTSLKPQNQSHGISPPISGSVGPIPNIGSSSGQRESPTQLEQDFLTSGGGGNTEVVTGWGEASFDEDYFSMIPEDTTLLNSSLSSSLSSLCGHKELLESAGTSHDVDKFKHIRKEAASRKAQFLSAATSTTNSPEASRHTAATGPGDDLKPPDMPATKVPLSAPSKNSKQLKKPLEPKAAPVSKKWNTNSDVDRVYGGREEKTYSQAFAARKILNTPTKPSYKANSQAKREKEKIQNSLDECDSISLEGHRLVDPEGAGSASRDVQGKKRTKKGDAVYQSHTKNRTTFGLSMYNSQEGSGERPRPTIERGGTNTISMEISGVGSRNNSTEGISLLSPNTKDSILHRKQKYRSESEHETSDKSSTEKPPLITQEDSSGMASTLVETSSGKKRKDKKNTETVAFQYRSRSHSESGGYGGATGNTVDTTPRSSRGGSNNRSTLTITDIDSPSSFTTRGNSPQEFDTALLESHVHSNPDQAIKTALQSIARDDWSNKCEGMIMVMCIARNYPAMLEAQLHTTVLAVQKEVKNLRSSVAKKAIECLASLFSTMKRAMEPDLDQVVQTLLHKGSESNVFLREVVDKTMMEMVTNVSPQKALVALIYGGASHRNAHVRKMTSKFVCTVVESYEPSKFLHSSKELLDKVLPSIVQFTKDGSPEARYYARKCLSLLWHEPDFFQVAGKVLKSNLYTEAKEIIETLKIKGIGEPPSESQSNKAHFNGSFSNSNSRQSTGGCVRLSVHSSMQRENRYDRGETSQYPYSSPSSISYDIQRRSRKQQGHVHETPMTVQEIPVPERLVERLQASNWSERYEAVNDLERYVVTACPQVMTSQLHKVFDAFCLRLTDRNSKVNLRALQAFSSMVPILSSALVPIINAVVGTLVPNLASRNLTIHSTAMTVLDLLSQNIDAVHLLPTVANSSQFGNARIQPIMTKILANLTPSAHAQKPQLVSRLVLPVIWHHIKTPVTGEAKIALQDLCRVLLDCMGQGFIDSATHLSMEDRKKLDDLLEHR